MNNVVVKIEMSGNRYNAYDIDGNKYTSEIGTRTRKGAYKAGMALERRIGKNDRVYWWKVPMDNFESLSVPEFDVSKKAAPKRKAPVREAARARKKSSALITVCEDCGGKISKRLDSCPHCGWSTKPTISCPDCGASFAASLPACPACGGPRT